MCSDHFFSDTSTGSHKENSKIRKRCVHICPSPNLTFQRHGFVLINFKHHDWRIIKYIVRQIKIRIDFKNPVEIREDSSIFYTFLYLPLGRLWNIIG